MKIITAKDLMDALGFVDPCRVLVLNIEVDKDDPPEPHDEYAMRGVIREIDVDLKNARQVDGVDRDIARVTLKLSDW